MRQSIVVFRLGAVLSFVLTGLVSLSAQVNPDQVQAKSMKVDSGYLNHTSTVEKVLFSKLISVPKVPWIRLTFDKTNLPTGSRIRISSLWDKAVQYLDGRSIRDYGYQSCYFNGG